MGSKFFFSLLFIIIAMSLLILYWFLPFSNYDFTIESQGSNFNLGVTEQAVQFYENMRFPDKRISYNINEDTCTLKKQEDMQRAFEIMEENTVLEFYEVNQDEEITIYCDSHNKIEEGLFIAGEGGPTNITKAGEFNVITHGKILLFRESSCPNPNIAIHELLHVLGFDHAQNPNDIMYEVSRCNQEINPATIEEINLLYSVPSYPDLVFENVSATMHGKYLDTNFSVRNNGFTAAPNSRILIYADNENIKEIKLEKLDIGHGRQISLTNVWINQLSVNTIKLEIVTPYNELKKENNNVLLKVKK